MPSGNRGVLRRDALFDERFDQLAPELREAPSKPVAGETDAMAFANLLPEEQTALRAPAGTGAVPAAPAASQPAPVPATLKVAAPAPASVRPAAPAPAGVSAMSAGRGMIDQVTPTRTPAKPAPKQESFFLDADASSSMGNVEFMRRSNTIRRTFPGNADSPGDKEMVAEVASRRPPSHCTMKTLFSAWLAFM
jgi:hypothetical protein